MGMDKIILRVHHVIWIYGMDKIALRVHHVIWICDMERWWR